MLHFIKTKANIFIKVFVCTLVLLSFCEMPLAKNTYNASNVQPQKLDKKKWEKITSDLDYTGISMKKKLEKREVESTDSFGDNEPIVTPLFSGNLSFGKGLFQAFVIAFCVALAVLIGYYFINGGFKIAPKKLAKRDEITLENIEENIHETELDYFIRKAKEQGNFALAVKLYYLSIIKELSVKKYIKWKRDKTNREYLQEIKQTDFHNPFQDLTYLFEIIRYGDGSIDEQEFYLVEPKFTTLISNIRQA